MDNLLDFKWDGVQLKTSKTDTKAKVKSNAGRRGPRFRPGMIPGPPYKCTVRCDTTDRFIKEPVNWETVVNRKTYNKLTGELIEDLDLYPDILCGESGEMLKNHDIHPTIPDEVLTRKLPNGVTYIKTVLEYGHLTYPKNPNRKK